MEPLIGAHRAAPSHLGAFGTLEGRCVLQSELALAGTGVHRWRDEHRDLLNVGDEGVGSTGADVEVTQRKVDLTDGTYKGLTIHAGGDELTGHIVSREGVDIVMILDGLQGFTGF